MKINKGFQGLALLFALTAGGCSIEKNMPGNQSKGMGPNTAAALHPVMTVQPDDAAYQKAVKHDKALFDKLFPVTRAALPAQADLSSNMPPVGDQSYLNSCEYWAVCYYAKTYYEGLENKWDITVPEHQFSAMWPYTILNSTNVSWYLTSVRMNYLFDLGCDLEANYPYYPINENRYPDEDSFKRASRYRNGQSLTISNDVNAIKQVIADNKIVVIGIPVWYDFDTLTTNNPVYDVMDTGYRGGHEVCLVGYDDAKQAFKFVNSWGASFGTYKDDNDHSKGTGYGWIAYHMLTNQEQNKTFYPVVLLDGTNNPDQKLYPPYMAVFSYVYSDPLEATNSYNFYTPLSVKFTNIVSGASFRYTTNGVDPSPTSGILYDDDHPIYVFNNMTIKSIAYKNGWNNSEIHTKTFFNNNADYIKPPHFSVNPGTYYGPQTVTIIPDVAGDTIRYSTNNDVFPDPNGLNSILYTGPITVSTGIKIYAAAYRPGYNASRETLAEYIIKAPVSSSSAPVVSSSAISSIVSSSSLPVSSSSAPSGVTLAAITSAVASTVLGGNTAAMTYDKSAATRWESAQGVDPQWIYWDLGSSKALSSIILDWETASASNYTIQGSLDASAWTAIAAATNAKAVNHLMTTNNLSGSYRYVRMYGTSRTTVYGYSIYEVSIYVSSTASSSSSIAVSSSLPASSSKSSAVSSSIPLSSSKSSVANSSSIASSVSSGISIIAATASTTLGGNTAAMTFDKNTGTRWESVQGADPQWIYWDLGSSKALSSVIIDWEAAAASNYTIQGSTDASAWTILATVVNNTYLVNHVVITNAVSGTFRYVKMNGTTRTSVYGYSIWETTIR